jgi:hypothetical protein
MKKRTKRNSLKGRVYTAKSKQARVVGRSLLGQNVSEIASEEQISRGTVYRIRSQSENAMLLQSYRDMVLDLVPGALKGLGKLIRQVDRQAIIETLYGSRVLNQRQEVEAVREPKRTYAYPKVEFFAKYGRWPSLEEAMEFEKTLDIKPDVKGELTE